MPVKIYVGRNSEGEPQPPDFTHEHLDFLSVTSKIWDKFHHLSSVYVVIANLQDPRADFVIISERGLGVVDFKKYDGRIVYSQGGSWFAEYPNQKRSLIKAGSERRANPHEQVQEYVKQIRQKLMTFHVFDWNWNAVTFSTGVCFTHPNVSVEDCKKQKERSHHPKAVLWEDWEHFDILTLDEMPVWVDALRFEESVKVSTTYGNRYDSYKLTPQQLLDLADTILNAVEYPQAYELMPTGKPYAYLLLKQDDEIIHSFCLIADEVTIGRDADCGVSIPEQFRNVSTTHAKIKRGVDGVFIEDLDSRNGTYIDGQQIQRASMMKFGQQITLGGKRAKKKVCLLEFSSEHRGTSSTIVDSQF